MNFIEDLFPWDRAGMIEIHLFLSIRFILQIVFCVLSIVFHFRNEQAFLISLTGLRSEKYFWIGLSDTEEQGTFRWTSGEAPLFTHWNSAMPGKLSMGTSLVIGVCLKFRQVSAFHLLILEIRAGTFVFTAVGDQHFQILCLSLV